MYEFQVDPENANIIKGNIKDLLYCIPVMVFIHFVRNAIKKVLHRPVFDMINVKRFPIEEKRLERANLLSKWMVDIVYYLSTSVAAFLIMRNQDSFPYILGGKDMFPNILGG
jgi:hypothetical protein